MTRANTSERVSRYLKRYMRKKKPGELLPSFRQVMRACQVGPSTVNDVVRQMEQQGLVDVQPQRGIFLRVDPASAEGKVLSLRQVDIVYFQGNSSRRLAPFHDQLVRELTTTATARGQNVRFHLVPSHDQPEEHLDLIVANTSCEALILINLPRIELLSFLDDRELPYVNLFPAAANGVPRNSLLIDPDQVVRCQVDHLCELGHQRIGFLHNIRETTYHRDLVLRREAFYRICLDRSLPVKSDWIRYVGYAPEERHAAIHALLEAPDRPTAVICADDHLPQLYRSASAFNLTIGVDLSIVGTNDDSIAEMLYPAVTTASIPRDEAAATALEMLEAVMEADDATVDTRYLAVRLILRGSTGSRTITPASGACA